MRRLAILISALLHVLPEFNHLTAVLGFARRPGLALARVAKEQEPLLLLFYDLSPLRRFRILVL
jgi:hypothetical protein